jgi:hypothetical protein
MFRAIPLSIIRSFSLYTQQRYISCRFADSYRAGSGWNCLSILILVASCQQICMIYTIVVCTVINSWWWTKELSETCRVLFQNKFEKLVHLVDFIIRNLSRCTVTWTSKNNILFTNKVSQQMQLSIYLYCIPSHPTCFGPPTGPSSGMSWAASSCRVRTYTIKIYT